MVYSGREFFSACVCVCVCASFAYTMSKRITERRRENLVIFLIFYFYSSLKITDAYANAYGAENDKNPRLFIDWT